MSQRLMRSGAAPMTGTFKVVDGAVGSPAVQFSGAPSTGLYKTTSGIGIAVDGTKVAEFTANGLLSGARWIGELVPFTGVSAAPALTVFPYGQTLSRTTYAALWAFAQTEIAAGNTFYNNGDGSTTFGIGDMRGRLPVGKDNMGGVAAGRVTSAVSGIDGTVSGSAGGAQSVFIQQNQLPNVSPGFTGQSQTVSSNQTNIRQGGTDVGGVSSGGGGLVAQVPAPTQGAISITFTPSGTVGSINGNVSQQGLNKMPPSMVTNYVLFAGA